MVRGNGFSTAVMKPIDDSSECVGVKVLEVQGLRRDFMFVISIEQNGKIWRLSKYALVNQNTLALRTDMKFDGLLDEGPRQS